MTTPFADVTTIWSGPRPTLRPVVVDVPVHLRPSIEHHSTGGSRPCGEPFTCRTLGRCRRRRQRYLRESTSAVTDLDTASPLARGDDP
jgi:hypothetical protein